MGFLRKKYLNIPYYTSFVPYILSRLFQPFGRFSFIWNDAYFLSWTHLAFSLSCQVGKQ